MTRRKLRGVGSAQYLFFVFRGFICNFGVWVPPKCRNVEKCDLFGTLLLICYKVLIVLLYGLAFSWLKCCVPCLCMILCVLCAVLWAVLCSVQMWAVKISVPSPIYSLQIFNLFYGLHSMFRMLQRAIFLLGSYCKVTSQGDGLV